MTPSNLPAARQSRRTGAGSGESLETPGRVAGILSIDETGRLTAVHEGMSGALRVTWDAPDPRRPA
jgi:hypothetical protein